jgi:hypothetical protein
MLKIFKTTFFNEKEIMKENKDFLGKYSTFQNVIFKMS